MFCKIVEDTVRKGSVCIADLQKRYLIGYARAARYRDRMIELGIISETRDPQTKKHLLLLSPDGWVRMQNEGFYEKNGDYVEDVSYYEPDFRFATRRDVPLILSFIRRLAAYEHLAGEVVADEKTLREWIFDRKKAEVIFETVHGKEIGFALFFHNFSTFLGRAGLYLEDLYVLPAYRGKGYGKRILRELARIAVERGCGRLEWWCLDSNRPSIDFYLSLGAEPMEDWTVYRLAGDTLKSLGETGTDENNGVMTEPEPETEPKAESKTESKTESIGQN